ncbi:MAG: glycosyltransferase family 39 protein [Anaerolineales bacterium]
MTAESLPTQPSASKVSWLDRLLWKRLTPATLILIAIMLLSAGLHFYNIAAIGDSNAYYTAAVKSMLQSWHNFFFVAAEPGGSVTVDKPPLGLWIEAAFAAVLGVSGFSVSLPNILAGIFSVPLLYHLVKKHLGTLAGLVAALVLALTPTVTGTDRNSTMDGMLAFCLLLAAWAFIAAAETGRLGWLLLGAFLVGLGFNIKMLQAFLPLPAFYALYFFGAKTKWWRKLAHLAAATVLLLAVSLAWAIAVDLTPPEARPYVGSSENNTVMELIVGHNGLERLLGGQRNRGAQPLAGADGPGGFNRNQSPDNPGQSDLPLGQPVQPPAGQQAQPPRQAVEACRDLTVGAACAIRLPNGGTDAGTCARVQGTLACVTANAPRLPGPANQNVLPAGQANGGAGGAFSNEVGVPSAVRLFIPPLAKEMSWLLPFALIGLTLLVVSVRPAWPLAAEHKAFLLWGGWLLTCVVFFSVAEFFHDYYMIMLAPPLGAAVGGGVAVLWRRRAQAWTAWTLALSAIGTLAFEWWLAVQYGQDAWWLRLAAVLLAAGLAALLTGRRLARRVVLSLAFALILAALLVTPLAWSVLTVAEQSPDVNLPGAYGGQSGGAPRALAGNLPQNAHPDPNRAAADSALVEFLQANTQGVEYLVAVPNAQAGAPLVLATGRPVLYMGGFSGGDPVVDAAGLEQMVRDGRLRFVLADGNRGPNQEIARWLEANCALVPRFSQGGRQLYACGWKVHSP